MAEAPKIPEFVRERLRMQQAALARAEHPDAGLLTAYSENALSAGERSRVLGHLADCQSCRDVIMLVQTEPAEAGVAPLLPKGRHRNWLTLRWAALVACVALTVGVVLMNRSLRQSERAHEAATSEKPARDSSAIEDYDQRTELSAPAEARQNSLAGKAESTSRGKADHKSFAPEKRNERAKYTYAPGRRSERQYGRVDSSAAKDTDDRRRQSTAVAGAKAVSPVVPPSTNVQNRAPGAAGEGTIGKLIFAAPSPQTAAGSASASETSTGEAETAQSTETRETQHALLREQEPGKKKMASEATAVVGGPVASRPQPRAQENKPVAPQPSAQAAGYFESKDESDTLTLNRGNLSPAGATPVQWRIRKGKLQQSTDEGKTWQEVNVAPGVSLHAFWAQGASVWAGGTGGSLFRITEDGHHSVRIPIKIGEGDVSQTVVGVTFSDELHGTIMLENGQVLQTANGGKSWERN